MTPLALSGTAKSVSGATVHTRHLLRLREARSEPVCEADAAIVRDDADLSIARDQGFGTAIIVDPCSASDPIDLGVVVHLDGRFGYLAAGDVIALDPESRLFRVLFRRASKHNSFLVTERCNHYCLMCSQPPRNVNGASGDHRLRRREGHVVFTNGALIDRIASDCRRIEILQHDMSTVPA
jgi:hypothetical protein